jgi:predicted ATP-dependent serine protease
MRSWVLERLDAEASAEASALVVAGDPGAGKSALILAALREVVREELERAGVKRAS